MAVGRVGAGAHIWGFSDREAWVINNSGLSQKEKDEWNAMRALLEKLGN
ncbi:MAG: hypothetical protein LBF49_03620 [Puniceicoccales bacterium]|jgi:predicted NUDIX family NTP pyrophosphohydrolase|nr:hypothetical protein [Puniceicoccales bacterium]